MSKDLKVTGRVLKISEATKKRNPGVFGEGSITNVPLYPPLPTVSEIDALFREPACRADVMIAKATQEEKLNKTERAYLAYLRRLYKEEQIGIQKHRLVLANGCTFTPDFCIAPDENGRVVFYDTKARWKGKDNPHVEDDALVKIKCAANEFRWALFRLTWKNKAGQWEQRDIKP